MANPFSTIGLIGKYTNPEVHSTLISLIHFLQERQCHIVVEEACADSLPQEGIESATRDKLGAKCSLVMVVGGDGSLLNAARVLVNHDVPVIGVNRGRRGFLTDISPQTLTQSLESILDGAFQEEQRFLLSMELIREKQVIGHSLALNEVVLYSGDIARIMEFEVQIDNQFVYRQRSDGLITATPTGSTAYALAGGGPILHSSLDAISLVPMHPALLSSRPIVVDSGAQIALHLTQDNIANLRVSCDGQVHFDAKPDDRIVIRRHSHRLRLLHPMDYDYYHTLRTKLGWSS